MATKDFKTDIDLNTNEIQNASFEKVAANPAVPFEGQFWQNTTDDRVRALVNGQIKDFAWLSDVAARMRYLGTFDASGGTITNIAGADSDGSTTIQAGDFWIVSVDGTLAGIGTGSDSVTIGDLVIATVDNPAGNVDWATIEQNLGFDPANAVISESFIVNTGDWAATAGGVDINQALANIGLVSSVVMVNAVTNEVEEFQVDPTIGSVRVVANVAPTDAYSLRVLGLA